MDKKNCSKCEVLLEELEAVDFFEREISKALSIPEPSDIDYNGAGKNWLNRVLSAIEELKRKQ